MKNNKFEWYFYFVVIYLVGFFSLSFFLWVTDVNSWCSNYISFFSFFMLDSVGFFLSFLVFFIAGIILFNFYYNSSLNLFLLLFCCFVTILTFFCVHSLGFWFFYETSILLILFLIFKDSPYSDRFMAGWYLLFYSLFSGVPMLVVILYISYLNNTFFLVDWFYTDSFCLFLLFLFFVTKIPIIPFHVWLPIVHAEASTITSICLSGFIMKLGFLGLIRFGFYNLNDSIVFSTYIILVLLSSVLIFFTSVEELDLKRWLAMLSLCHIGVGLFSLFCLNILGCPSSMIFSLGHGLAASFFFYLILLLGNLGGSRSALNLSYISGWSFSISWLLLIGFCFSASFPPFINFFIEVWLVGLVSTNFFYFFILLSYLFFSSLIPLLLLGLSFSRRLNSSVGLNYNALLLNSYFVFLGILLFVV
uniref:NADH-ubiquinone oxidoreductase chain 4 n=1 Tax=Neomazocraes dorosomatis TaxID=1131909 RepID=A0A3G0WUW2_9PLAT|nr:NADH dehydrogenase subunit 4 [Neomazocraes dorosomatis]